MLSPDEEKYLGKIPENKMVKIEPFDLNIPEITKEIVEMVHSVAPELEVRHMGASALGISGQGDLDMYILCPENEYHRYLVRIESVFGPKVPNISIIKWAFIRQGHEVEMYLTNPSTPSMQKQIRVFELLKSNPNLLKEYEGLKKGLDGRSFREYQRRKYEFYHKITE